MRLEQFAALVVAENTRQNLISPSTINDIWTRHIEDSLQLIHLGERGGLWIDIGSGAGFPGLVVAIATERPTMLIEPRRLRAAFLRDAASRLGCTDVEVRESSVQSVRAGSPAVISARAVAPLAALFERAVHLAAPETRWILPKGRNASTELAEAEKSWHGEFRIEPSMTDPDAGIVIATNVWRRAGRR